jgi:hypothetical protein
LLFTNIGFSGEAQSFDIFRGTNFDAISRLNRMSGAEMPPRSPRRNTVGAGSWGASRSSVDAQARPNSALSMNMPDPLFGRPVGNAFPSPSKSFDSRMAAMRHRHSLTAPSSPRPDSHHSLDDSIDAIDLSPLRFSRNEKPEDPLHHSMPNLYISDWDPLELKKEENLHNSAPTINYDMNDDGDESLGSDVLEPIPLDEITPRPGAKKGISGEGFKQKLSMTLSPT